MTFEQLIRGGRIATTTYSFSQSADVYARGQEAVVEALRTTFAPLAAAQQDTVRATFHMIEAVTPLRFSEVEAGEIRFALGDLVNTIGSLGIGFFPSQGSASDSDVWFTTITTKSQAALDRPGFASHLVQHEILHALGLQHPANQLIGGTSLSIFMGQKPGVQPLDLLALQAIYGPGDTLSGTVNDDNLRLDSRIDAVAGGAGFDTLWLAGKRSDYLVTVDGDRAVVSGNGFNTSVSGVEKLNFTTERGEQLNRLYEAAWAGPADRAGFDFWLVNETPLAQIALALVSAMRGDGESFIQTLYAQALGRTPSAAEVAWHVATLESRADKLLEFSESPENRAQVVAVGLPEESVVL